MTIVVLNWNGATDTIACVSSLAATAYPHLRILVVDNGSDTSDRDRLTAALPGVAIELLPQNLGYTGGNNHGLRIAEEDGADIIGVLNNDTVVEPDFLEPLLAHLGVDTNCAVSPLITLPGDGIWFSGAQTHPATGLPVHLQAQPVTGDPVETTFLSGCALFAPAAVWREVGGFTPGFFLLFEDVDWSYRAASLGIRLVVIPEARVLHKVSRSIERVKAVSSYLYARNGMVTIRTRTTRRIRHAIGFAGGSVLRPHMRGWLRGEQSLVALVAASAGLAVGATTARGGPPPRLIYWLQQRDHRIATHGRRKARPSRVDERDTWLPTPPDAVASTSSPRRNS